MRISDWSSDVCSSDLGTRVGAVAPEDRQPEVVAGGDRRGDRAGCGHGQTSVGCSLHLPRCRGEAASQPPSVPACDACPTQPRSLPPSPPPPWCCCEPVTRDPKPCSSTARRMYPSEPCEALRVGGGHP